MPQVVVPALIGAGLSPLLANIVFYVGSFVITWFVSRALAPDMSDTDNGRLLNVRNPISPQEYVYGRVRKGGTITFMKTTGTSNRMMHMVIALAGRPVNEIEEIYINDEVVTLDANGFVTDDRWCDEDGNKKIRVRKHNGTQTTVDAKLYAEAGVPDNFIGYGIAYIYVRLEYDRDVFAGGIPTFTALIKGHSVYDPRTGTTGYSANAALCIRDYLVSEIGMNDGGSVNNTYFSAAANDCDDAITLKSGATQVRYRIDGVIKSDQNIGVALQKMVQSCNGTLYFSSGEWRLRVGVYEAATLDPFTEDDLRGDLQVQTRVAMRDNFNRVTGTFPREGIGTGDWIETDYPAVKSDYFEEIDDGYMNAMELPLPMVTNSARAQRIAKQVLYRNREQITVAGDFGVRALQVEVGDTITLTLDDYGWTEKEFFVTEWKMFVAEEGGTRVHMAMRETSSAAFDWSTIDEEELEYNNTTLLTFNETVKPGVSVDADLRSVNEQIIGALVITCTADDDMADYFEAGYRVNGETVWKSLGKSDDGVFEAIGIENGGLYDVRAKTVNPFGVSSGWTTLTGIEANLYDDLPADVEDFWANPIGHNITLTWTPIVSLALSHYRIRFSSEANATYANSSNLLDVARPASTVTIPARSGTYFIKAIDKIGQASENAASVQVTTDLESIANLNVVETLVEAPTFPGTTTNTVVTSNDGVPYIVLDSTLNFDSATGDFDDAEGLFDAATPAGSVQSSGYYEFSDYVDLGGQYTSRIWVDMEMVLRDYVETFDEAGGAFDTRSGLFDGDSTAYDRTSVKVQIAMTDDDPAGTPTWSSWQDLIAGDFTARAFKFRVYLATEVDGVSPSVTYLTANIDMPDRVESDNDINFTGSQAVTFGFAFHETPAIAVAVTMADGDRYAITSKSRTGFTITVYDGVSVSANTATFDYVAKGYGKETT